jgi:uncharacterized protein YecE (DUF72 family)
VGRSRAPGQLDLFGGGAAEEPPRPKGVGAAEVPAEVAALGRELPAGLRMGPSSWSFPGWAELVYDRKYPESRLAKEGLAAVARHPLFRAVGIDRTHYAPVPAAELAAYAAQVPEKVPGDFRFLVKAHEALTLARWPDRPRYGRERGLANPRFLDAAYASAEVVAPYAEGLGRRAGALLFQFAPQDLGSPEGFAAELHAFLRELPRGPLYAVELRNRELLTPRYAEALAAAGAVHCVNAHPRMPDVATQARVTGAGAGRPLVLRWLLGRGETYADAGRRFAPFDRLMAEDPPTRRAIAHLVRAALAGGQGALLTVNNNAEGSAPRSMARLAAEVLRPEEGS